MQTKVQTQYQFKLSETEYATLARLAARGLRAENPDGDVDEDDLVTVLTFVQYTGIDVWEGEGAQDAAEDWATGEGLAEGTVDGADASDPDERDPDMNATARPSASKPRFGIRRRHSA